jgi:hypothetical protein
MPDGAPPRTRDSGRLERPSAPARGLLSLVVSTSNDEVKAGSNFSIFVTATNPYDVPVTLYQIVTHVPVELLDINSYTILVNKRERESQHASSSPFARLRSPPRRWFQTREDIKAAQTGTAIALGTELAPEEARSLFGANISIDSINVSSDGRASVAGVALNFPQNPSAQELDAIMRRLVDYQRGNIPVTLQPGDSVVRQFVLRTRSRILFTPLAHTFEIQATYSVDGLDHTVSIPFRLNIRAAMSSIIIGAILGAVLGGVVRGLSTHGSSGSLQDIARGTAVAVLASIAVVAAFARRSNAQPFVSVEDFWGGIVIGFSVGFFGFSQFAHLLGGT